MYDIKEQKIAPRFCKIRPHLDKALDHETLRGALFGMWNSQLLHDLGIEYVAQIVRMGCSCGHSNEWVHSWFTKKKNCMQQKITRNFTRHIDSPFSLDNGVSAVVRKFVQVRWVLAFHDLCRGDLVNSADELQIGLHLHVIEKSVLRYGLVAKVHFLNILVCKPLIFQKTLNSGSKCFFELRIKCRQFLVVQACKKGRRASLLLALQVVYRRSPRYLPDAVQDNDVVYGSRQTIVTYRGW